MSRHINLVLIADCGRAISVLRTVHTKIGVTTSIQDDFGKTFRKIGLVIIIFLPVHYCIFTAEDSKGADETEAMANSLIERLKDTFSSYDPEEVTKLNSAIVRKKGSYVVLLVTNDYDNANKKQPAHINNMGRLLKSMYLNDNY